jgi:hypothetical protein
VRGSVDELVDIGSRVGADDESASRYRFAGGPAEGSGVRAEVRQ